MSTYTDRAFDKIIAERAAEKLRTRVDGAVETLQGVPAKAEHVAANLAAGLDRVRNLDVEKVGRDYVDRENERLVAEATAAADRLEQAAIGSVGTVGEFTAAQSGPSDPTAALLAETRQARAWDRQRGQLDAGVDALTLVERARVAGDHSSLLAMRAEYGAYQAAAGRAVVDAATVDRYLDAAVMDTAPKADRARLQVERAAATGAESAERAVAALRRQVTTLGNPRQNTQALDHAVRVQDVVKNGTIEAPFRDRGEGPDPRIINA